MTASFRPSGEEGDGRHSNNWHRDHNDDGGEGSDQVRRFERRGIRSGEAAHLRICQTSRRSKNLISRKIIRQGKTAKEDGLE